MNKIDISNETILNLAAHLEREETTQFLAEKFRALLFDREWLRGGRDGARGKANDLMAEHHELREALARAIEYVDLWSCYADPVYQEKHDLEGNLRDLRAVLEATKP
jgi:hypothetical protein